jgi:hypothetical protein
VEAIIGFVGVVVGGLLAGGTSLLMARRVERSKAKASARLLEDELLAVKDGLDRFKGLVWLAVGLPDLDAEERRRKLWAAHERHRVELSDEEWVKHRATLAQTLPAEDWYRVRDAYATFPNLKHLASLHDDFPVDERRVDPEPVITASLDAIEAGLRALSQLAGSAGLRKADDRPDATDALIAMMSRVRELDRDPDPE